MIGTRFKGLALLAAGLVTLAGCGGGLSDEAATRAIADAAKTGKEWLTYGGSYDEQRYSQLGAITKDNVSTLGIAWSYDMKVPHGVEATPIVSDGVMYVTSAWSIVYALDAKSGKASSRRATAAVVKSKRRFISLQKQ